MHAVTLLQMGAYHLQSMLTAADVNWNRTMSPTSWAPSTMRRPTKMWGQRCSCCTNVACRYGEGPPHTVLIVGKANGGLLCVSEVFSKWADTLTINGMILLEVAATIQGAGSNCQLAALLSSNSFLLLLTTCCGLDSVFALMDKKLLRLIFAAGGSHDQWHSRDCEWSAGQSRWAHALYGIFRALMRTLPMPPPLAPLTVSRQ